MLYGCWCLLFFFKAYNSFLGDASVEEDYVLASLSWAAKKELPILFVVEDNNYAVLTKKEDRRDWKAKDVAKAFKLNL